MNKPYLSLCMIVRNESKNLARCLDSLQRVVNEIVIVDTGSQDNTKEIALSYGAMVFDYEWHDDFAAARNYAIIHASGEWILSIDADEEVFLYEDLQSFLREQVPSILCSTFYLYQAGADSNKLEKGGYYFRIFRRDSNLHFKGMLHEQLFYKNQSLTRQEVTFFNEKMGFIKHNGDADGNSLRKCREFYIPMLERIASKEPISMMLLGYLSDYYSKLGEFDKSLECYEQAIERLMPFIISGERPVDFLFVPTWLTTLCDYYFKEKDIENLFLVLPRALQWCDKFPALFNIAGKMFVELGLYLGAIAYFQKSIDLCVNGTHQSSAIFEAYVPSLEFIISESYYSQGCCYMKLKEWIKAIASLEQCLFIDGKFGDAREKIVWIKKEIGGDSNSIL